MSKRQIIMVLGTLVAIIQFLGFPASWNKFFTFIMGILILIIAYKMAPRVKTFPSKELPFQDHKRETDGEITNPNISEI